MKQKDIALIIVIAGISGFVSFFLSHFLFARPVNTNQKAAVVDKIDVTFEQPSSKYFNAQSINPAQTILVGDNNNQNPFSGSGQ